MSNFKAWLDSADMPMQKADGSWYDAETGIAYVATQRATLSAKASDARSFAKAFGGKALTGTAKQKEWAEKIRAEKICEMDSDSAALACDHMGLGASAKFWIENRAKSGADFGKFFQQQQGLLKLARSLKAKGMAKEYAEAAERYNALTSAWGFN